MTRHQLAQELRARQYAYGEVERHIIDALSDQDIIECYITCSDCGHQQVQGKELEYAISTAYASASAWSARRHTSSSRRRGRHCRMRRSMT